MIEKKQNDAMKGIKRIVELTPALQRFEGFVRLRDDEWERRNRTMVKNILSRARENPGKRIVVLCSFEHRFFLSVRL